MTNNYVKKTCLKGDKLKTHLCKFIEGFIVGDNFKKDVDVVQ